MDEQTNSLNLDSMAQLATALRQYRGALLVADHDEPFLAEIGIDRRLELGAQQPKGTAFDPRGARS